MLIAIVESDLNPLSTRNILTKYADGTNLLVSVHTECILTEELLIFVTGLSIINCVLT